MTAEQSVKLFAIRDQDFDFCRSFLVVSMIFTHVFQSFYLPDYNRRLTFFVTIGFVFISGFAIAGKNAQRVGRTPWKYFIGYLRRFAKILLVYIVCNIPIIILEPSRLELLQDTPIFTIFWIVLSGEGSAVFGFDILPAIALTSLFAWAVMGATKRIGSRALLLSLIPFLLLWLFEFSVGAKFIAIRLLLTGLFGCLLGKAASHIDWQHFLKTMSDLKIMAASGFIVAIYFLAIAFHFWPDGPILLWRHLIPTSVLIFFVYMLSYKCNLKGKQWVRFSSTMLSEYMLFSYIFHIGIIKLARVFVESNFNFIDTLFIGLLFTGITITVCFFLEMGRKRVLMISRLYSVLFGF